MQLNATRRSVVKAGAATAAALGISGILTSSEIANAEEADSSQEECVDVVVVGAGAAGLATAATASEAGAAVVVLESGSFAGGATLYSGGHMLWLDEEFNATQERNDADLEKYLDFDPETLGEAAGDVRVLQGQVQDYLADSTRTGKFDSIERVMVDHYLKGAGTDCDGNPVHLDYAIIRAAAETNMEVFAWLQSGGMEIKDTPYGMHANSPVNGGSSLVDALLNLTESAGAQVRYETKATGLVVDDGTVAGVRYVGKDARREPSRPGALCLRAVAMRPTPRLSRCVRTSVPVFRRIAARRTLLQTAARVWQWPSAAVLPCATCSSLPLFWRDTTMVVPWLRSARSWGPSSSW